MKELDFLNIIEQTLSKSSYIGDDCAYLKDLGIVVTQDSLVENIHFSMQLSTPYQLGYKSVMVNLSDVYASGAIPKYLTISLSLPSNTEESFIKDFYKACNDLAEEYKFEIVGGDITGSDKIFISICAIGVTKDRYITSRKNANVGDYVVTTGNHGSSAAGLWMLQNGCNKYPDLIDSHLMPIAQRDFSTAISKKVKRYAQMDTSDGLADALFKIAKESNVSIEVDFDKIPYLQTLIDASLLANVDYKDWIFYGGEDFQLVACVNPNDLKEIDSKLYNIIGVVKEKNIKSLVKININEDDSLIINNLDKTFNHFKE